MGYVFLPALESETINHLKPPSDTDKDINIDSSSDTDTNLNHTHYQHDLERAKEVYLEGIGVEADCIQAIYNLGLVNKQLGVLKEALQVSCKVMK